MGIFSSGSMKYFTVAVMTAINLLNYVDRYTIAGKYLGYTSPPYVLQSAYVYFRHPEGAGQAVY